MDKLTFPLDPIHPNVHIIRTGDSDWRFTVGMVHYPRASFEIQSDIPSNYKDLLKVCINRGWIKPIAYMKESEYVWEKLQQD